jgi:histidyl-tRNA synthetase
MSGFKTVRGMRDFLPEDAKKMRYVEQMAIQLALLYGFEEVITPIMESYELLSAKAGEEIRLRMYAFNDMGGRKVGLRPEFTPSIARLVANQLKNTAKPLKLFAVGSLYRYDEPQYGRFREFWQANYELVGSSRPEADAEILTMASDLMNRIGIHNYYLKIGHMGIIRGLLSQEGINEDSQNRIMQLLDKKQWEEALKLAQELGASEKCYTTLKNLIQTSGKNIEKVLHRIKQSVKDFEDAVTAVKNLQEILYLAKNRDAEFETLIEAGFARGLEYYTGMVFELYVPELEIALGGGGRYNKLIELFGGESTPSVGVALGIDRIVLAMEKQKLSPNLPEQKRVMIIPIEEEMKVNTSRLAYTLRHAGIAAEVEVMGRTVSKALADADRRGFQYSVLIGPEEASEGKVILRNMKKREQVTVKMENLLEEITHGQ